MDKVSDLKIDQYDYADIIKKYELNNFYPCVNKYNIVRFKISNTDRLFMNTLRRIMIAFLPAKRFECNSVPAISNGLINYIIPDEIKFRIGLLQLSYDINPDLVFEIKYVNNTFKPVNISTKHITCVTDPKINISDYVNYVDQILTLQPTGSVNISDIRIVENNVQGNARFAVVTSCGFSCENLGADDIEATTSEENRTYNLVFRYMEKYDIKTLFKMVADIIIEKLNNIENNTIEYDDRIEITFPELYTISNILYENLINNNVIVKQQINDENKIIVLKIYDLKDKKIINDIINKFITRVKSFVTQF